METMTKQLASAQRSGVYQLVRSPEEVAQAAKQAGLAVFRIDLAHTRSKKDFLDRTAKALNFPDWFGRNWDGLNDCLTDLDWLNTKTGYVLVFENIEQFVAHKQDFNTATAVLTQVSQYWKAEGQPFWALVTGSSEWESGLPRWPK
jgi:RNAse (barnase) inhibitor barstar